MVQYNRRFATRAQLFKKLADPVCREWWPLWRSLKLGLYWAANCFSFWAMVNGYGNWLLSLPAIFTKQCGGTTKQFVSITKQFA